MFDEAFSSSRQCHLTIFVVPLENCLYTSTRGTCKLATWTSIAKSCNNLTNNSFKLKREFLCSIYSCKTPFPSPSTMITRIQKNLSFQECRFQASEQQLFVLDCRISSNFLLLSIFIKSNFNFNYVKLKLLK